MDCVVTPVKTLMVFSVHLNVQLKFYNLPNTYQAESYYNAELAAIKTLSYFRNLSRLLVNLWYYFSIENNCHL